jgi:hypothetical protein
MKDKATVTFRRNAFGEVTGEIVATKHSGNMTAEKYRHR